MKEYRKELLKIEDCDVIETVDGRKATVLSDILTSRKGDKKGVVVEFFDKAPETDVIDLDQIERII